MKLKFGLFLAVLMSGTVMVNAQGGPGGRMRSVEERVQLVHAKLDSAFKLETAKIAQADSAFATYYRAQDKLRQEMMSGGERPDMQAMREKMMPLVEARDKELKAVLTEEQFKKWKEEIEPAMSPRRGPGGGGNRQ